MAGATIALHAFLWPQTFFGARLPHGAYFEPVLAARIFDRPRLTVLLAAHVLWVVVAGRRYGWSALDPGRRARGLVTGVAVMFAYTLATAPYNLYYDQAHLVDRLLLLALAALVWAHPAWVQAFVLLLLVIANQTAHPLPAGWIWLDKRLPLDFLILFTSYLYVRPLVRPRRHALLVLALALTGAAYSFAALSKLRLGPDLWSWVAENKLSNLLVSSYVTSGWLGWLGEERVVSLAQVAARIDPLLTAVTLGLEIAGFAILLRPRLTRLVLVGFVLMHTGILLASGIFFWKWVVFDLLLLRYFDRLRRDSGTVSRGSRRVFRIDRRLYAVPTIALLILTVAGTDRYFYNASYAWWDTRFANQVRLYAVTLSGERPIDGRFFAPYDAMFVQARFFYLVEAPVLCDTFGTTQSYPLARALDGATPADIPRLRREHGRLWYSESQEQVFAGFVHRFVTVASARGGRGVFLQHLAPPSHFQGTAPADAYSPARDPVVERIEVVWEETLFDGERIVPVVRGRLHAIPLADARGAPGEPARARSRPPSAEGARP